MSFLFVCLLSILRFSSRCWTFDTRCWSFHLHLLFHFCFVIAFKIPDEMLNLYRDAMSVDHSRKNNHNCFIESMKCTWKWFHRKCFNLIYDRNHFRTYFYLFSSLHSKIHFRAVYWLCYVLIIIFRICSKFVVDLGSAAWQWFERLQNLKLDGFRIHLMVFVLFIHVRCLLLGWQWWAALKLNK